MSLQIILIMILILCSIVTIIRIIGQIIKPTTYDKRMSDTKQLEYCKQQYDKKKENSTFNTECK